MTMASAVAGAAAASRPSDGHTRTTRLPGAVKAWTRGRRHGPSLEPS